MVSLQAKFCSTVANDVMLDTSVGVVRMWADETSRLSRFRMLFTSFADRELLPEIIPHFTLSSFILSVTATSVASREHCRLNENTMQLY